jgi:hypothetical protein
MFHPSELIYAAYCAHKYVTCDPPLEQEVIYKAFKKPRLPPYGGLIPRSFRASNLTIRFAFPLLVFIKVFITVSEGHIELPHTYS